MGLIGLIFCVLAAWLLSSGLTWSTHLPQLFALPHWLWLGIALVLATWLMRDESTG